MFKLPQIMYLLCGYARPYKTTKHLFQPHCNDGMYYEITYDGDKKETYVDAYKK